MIAILCKQRNLARAVSELMTEETKVYFSPEAVVEEKVIVIGATIFHPLRHLEEVPIRALM